jgi:hypothetical protein
VVCFKTKCGPQKMPHGKMPHGGLFARKCRFLVFDDLEGSVGPQASHKAAAFLLSCHSSAPGSSPPQLMHVKFLVGGCCPGRRSDTTGGKQPPYVTPAVRPTPPNRRKPKICIFAQIIPHVAFCHVAFFADRILF